jgi:hypothetical protein
MEFSRKTAWLDFICLAWPAAAPVSTANAQGEPQCPSGSWVLEPRSDDLGNGHFVTVWKRDTNCRWHAEIDGGVSHGVIDEAAGQAISEFRDTARQDGFAAALRTYAADTGFEFYGDGQVTIEGPAAASAYLRGYARPGAWKEDARSRSADSTVAYSVGEFVDGSKQSTHAYLEIWRYDPKVANWGLRVLLVSPLPPPSAKS